MNQPLRTFSESTYDVFHGTSLLVHISPRKRYVQSRRYTPLIEFLVNFVHQFLVVLP